MAVTGATSPRGWSSVVSAGAWLVIAVVIVRMASGGGSIAGFDYVVRKAPLAAVGGAALLLAAVALIAGFLSGAAWATRLSAVAGIAAIIFGLVLGVRGHDSAWVLIAAALVALLIGWRERMAT